jgi:hypothetical protein
MAIVPFSGPIAAGNAITSPEKTRAGFRTLKPARPTEEDRFLAKLSD